MIMTLPDLELADEDENGHTFVHHLCMGPMAERYLGKYYNFRIFVPFSTFDVGRRVYLMPTLGTSEQ